MLRQSARMSDWATAPPSVVPGPATMNRSGANSRAAVRMARVLRTAADTPAAATDHRPVVIEIGRARVAVVAGFDRPTLAAVLELLGVGAGR